MSFGLFLLYVHLTFVRPFELFWPELAELRPMLVMSMLTLALSLRHAFTNKSWAGRSVNIKLLLAFLAVVVISGATSGYAGSVPGAVNYLLPSTILYVLVLLNVTSLKRLKWAAAVAALSIATSAALSVNAFHTGLYAKELVFRQQSPAFDDPLAEETLGQRPAPDALIDVAPADDASGWWLWRIRGVGNFNDPNDFAQAMVMALPILWALWRKRHWMFNTVVVLIPSAVMGYTIYLTHSRGAVLGCGAIALYEIRKRIGTVWTSVFLAATAAAGLAVSIGGRGFTSQEKSAGDRIEAWYEGFQMLKGKPLFGVGLNNFVEHNAMGLTAHNSFVLAFSELGLVGYFVWLALIMVSALSLHRVITVLPKGCTEARWADRLTASFVGFFVCAWFLSRSYEPQLFLLIGLAMGGWYVGTKEPVARMKGSESYEQIREITWVKPTLIGMFVTMVMAYAFVKLHGMT